MAEGPLELSPRERQIADLLLQGCDNAEISKLLKMKRRTVKAYMNRLFRRFEIKDGIKRVKLATLLYRRFHSGRPPVAPAKWQTPGVEMPTTRDADAKLNIGLTA